MNPTIADLSRKRLEELYLLIPKTKCTRGDCRRQCCSKGDAGAAPGGKFMSLPLVYSVEYWNIDRYIRDNFGPLECERFHVTERVEKVCVFFDEVNWRCEVYPVRPLSCRLFGFDLPDMLWGMKFGKDAMKRVYCEDMEVLEPERYGGFVDSYGGMWDLMSLWSIANPVLMREQSAVIKERLGFDNIYLLGWVEFNRLRFSDQEWLREHIGEFWKEYGQSL